MSTALIGHTALNRALPVLVLGASFLQTSNLSALILKSAE